MPTSLNSAERDPVTVDRFAGHGGRRRRIRRAVAASAVSVGLLAAIASGVPATAATESAVAYRERPGGAAWWSSPLADGAVELYGDRISILSGERIRFHVHSRDGLPYELRLWRLDGTRDGATRIACDERCSRRPGIVQPPAEVVPETNEIRAPWSATDSLRIGRDWPSGYYIAQAVLLEGPQRGAAAYTPFIVRRARSAKPAPILLEIPMSTAAAYNEWGG